MTDDAKCEETQWVPKQAEIEATITSIHAIVDTSPLFHSHAAWSCVHHAIHLLKAGFDEIPAHTRRCLLTRLNTAIKACNGRLPPEDRIQGPIMHLARYKGHRHDTLMLLTFECDTCKHTWKWSGPGDDDVYGPPSCVNQTCGSIEIREIPPAPHQNVVVESIVRTPRRWACW